MKHLLLLTLVALLSCNDNKSGDPDNDEDSTSNETIAPNEKAGSFKTDSGQWLIDSTMKDTLR
jgi:hypothetical protein